jgi:hypothetical protein
MSNSDYRYYRLDGAGRLYEAEWVKAESDQNAIEQVRTKHPTSTCALWQGTRLVAKIAPKMIEVDFPSMLPTGWKGSDGNTAA